jgi:hypothetical protein
MPFPQFNPGRLVVLGFVWVIMKIIAIRGGLIAPLGLPALPKLLLIEGINSVSISGINIRPLVSKLGYQCPATIVRPWS